MCQTPVSNTMSPKIEKRSDKMPTIETSAKLRKNTDSARNEAKPKSTVVRLPRLASGQHKGSSSGKMKHKIDAKRKWLYAERRLTVSAAFPKLVAAQVQERQSVEEQQERAKFQKLLDTLPHVHAQLTQSHQIDAFLEQFFLEPSEDTDASEKEAPVDETAKMEKSLDRFLRFCRLHADFEEQRRVFYSLCARQLVKDRQLELIEKERDTYKERANFVEKLLNHAAKCRPTSNNTSECEEPEDIRQSFEDVVERFADSSFALCSAKSRLEFLETKSRLQKDSEIQRTDPEQLNSMNSELNTLRKHLVVLEESISHCAK
ncbi:hypothetical protein Ddc_02100 [Ditylenchus destructor]|nr:hypothetical protein Ddc_02100 [Ditylenchus destructor]